MYKHIYLIMLLFYFSKSFSARKQESPEMICTKSKCNRIFIVVLLSHLVYTTVRQSNMLSWTQLALANIAVDHLTTTLILLRKIILPLCDPQQWKRIIYYLKRLDENHSEGEHVYTCTPGDLKQIKLVLI